MGDPNRTFEYRTPTGVHHQSQFVLKRPAVLNRTFFGGYGEPGGPNPGETWDGDSMWQTYYADGRLHGGGQPRPSHPVELPMDQRDYTVPQEPLFLRTAYTSAGETVPHYHRNGYTEPTDVHRYSHPVHTLGTWDTVPRYTVGSVDGTADVMAHSSDIDAIVSLKRGLANVVAHDGFRPIPMNTTDRGYQLAANRVLSGSWVGPRLDVM